MKGCDEDVKLITFVLEQEKGTENNNKKDKT